MKIDTLNWTPPLPASPLARPVLHLDLSETNPALKRVPVDDPVVFGQWIRAQVAASGCDWALGGYAEDRAIYSMSPVFADGDATRSIHLGVDFWLPAGTEVYAARGGVVSGNGACETDFVY